MTCAVLVAIALACAVMSAAYNASHGHALWRTSPSRVEWLTDRGETRPAYIVNTRMEVRMIRSRRGADTVPGLPQPGEEKRKDRK